MWLVDTKTVWVETREELEKAINQRTAIMLFLNTADPDGQIKRAEWIEGAKKHNIPTLNDAAADVPPTSACMVMSGDCSRSSPRHETV